VAETIIAAGYVVGDFVLLVLVSLLLRSVADARAERALAWLCGALGLLMCADIAWLTAPPTEVYASGGLSDVLSVIAGALLATAALFEVHDTDGSARTLRTIALERMPYVALVCGAVAVFWDQLRELAVDTALVSIFLTIATLLILIRQSRASRQVVNMERALAARAADARFSALVQHAHDVVLVVDRTQHVRFATPSAARLFARAIDDLVPARLPTLVADSDSGHVSSWLNEVLEPRDKFQRFDAAEIEFVIDDAARGARTVAAVGSNLCDDPNIDGILVTLRDVTEHKRLEARLRELAFQDPLTSLVNRRLFRDRVEDALATPNSELGILLVDLDDFKRINDGHGHDEGDRLLRAVAHRLMRCVRSTDTVARLGGDEFAVLVVDANAVVICTEIATRMIDALSRPLAVGTHQLVVSASVGIATRSRDEDADALLRNADVAMYQAKATRKGTFAIYDESMQSKIVAQVALEASLNQALDRNEFFLQFQPIVELSSNYLIGVEALLRWCRDGRETVMPNDFIGLTETTGQIVPITRWVLQEACAAVRALQRQHAELAGLRVSVNVSARHFERGNLLADVQQALASTGLQPQCLVLEITESVLAIRDDACIATLRQLRALGVRIAIDDFGTGYSSLAYLHSFPVDIVKIDRSFVARIGSNNDGLSFARALLSLGQALELDVVAEGVESEAQRHALRELGCLAAQGYLFGRPGSLADVENSLAAKRRRVAGSTDHDLSPSGVFRQLSNEKTRSSSEGGGS
jgi:diguanylate cyclase (GGDEF)-like protein/PAS domain S-box-containing protein